MRRIVVLLLAAAITLSLSACTGNSKDNDNQAALADSASGDTGKRKTICR